MPDPETGEGRGGEDVDMLAVCAATGDAQMSGALVRLYNKHMGT